MKLIRCLFVLFALSSAAAAAEDRTLKLPDRTEVPIAVAPAAGDTLLVWLPPGIPGASVDPVLLRALTARGIEVWRPDLLEARFLPELESSLAQVPDGDLLAVIAAARATGKRVALLAVARAGALALRAAHAWQAAHPGDATLLGAVLLYPNLYLGPPEPGREAGYQPIVGAARLPLVVIQPDRSPWHFRVDALRAVLERSGATVRIEPLAGVRDRFDFRADATPAENAAAARLPQLIADALATLRAVPAATGSAPPAAVSPAAAGVPRDRELREVAGTPAAPLLHLARLGGGEQDLAALRGRVVLVNFWASWCPPCVREMPSLARLQEKMAGRPFDILAVNMDEPEPEVRAFLARHGLDLPVLLDRGGAALKAWKVFVFPTSFVIGPDGRIRYGLYGELEWDRPDVVARLEALLPRP